MKNNLLSKLLTGALLLVVFLFCFSKTQTAYAITYEVEGNNSAEEAMRIELNETIEGIVESKYDQDWYFVYINGSGVLSFSLSLNDDNRFLKAYGKTLSEHDTIVVRFYDSKMTGNVFPDRGYVFSLKDMNTNKYSLVGVSTGLYYVSVETYSDSFRRMPYDLTVSLENSNSWETEKNDSKQAANQIVPGFEYSAYIMTYRDSDWYRFTLEKDGFIRLIFPYHEFSQKHIAAVRLYGADGYTKIGSWDIDGSEYFEYYQTGEIGLSAGDYYLCVAPEDHVRWENTADQDRFYRFKIVSAESAVWEKESNDSGEFCNYLKVDEFLFGAISDPKDVDCYHFVKGDEKDYVLLIETPKAEGYENYWHVHVSERFGLSREWSVDIPGYRMSSQIELNGFGKGSYFIEISSDPENCCTDPYHLTVIEKKNEIVSGKPETHSFSPWVITKEATCTSEGQKTRTCFKCGFTEVTNIEKKEHVQGGRTTVEKPKCDKNGLVEIKCAFCGCFIKYESIPRVEHKPEMKIVKEPSCSEEGKREWICSMCGKKMGSEVIAKTPHRHEKWITVKEPTCEEEGLRRLICEDCNEVLREEKTEGLQHNYGAIRKARGNLFHAPIVYEQECSICGKVIRTEVWDYKWIPDAVYIGSTALLMVTGALIAVLVSVKEREKVRRKAVTKK